MKSFIAQLGMGGSDVLPDDINLELLNIEIHARMNSKATWGFLR